MKHKQPLHKGQAPLKGPQTKMQEGTSRKKILFVTAHPDDESMFFLPCISAVMQCDVWLLCLSVGDYEGLGTTRKRELEKCCQQVLHIQVEIVDHPQLKDGPHLWDTKVVADVVQDFIIKKEIDEVLCVCSYALMR
jgi:N-acetylglucosaminylphosphatidylinositol deacetylase